MSKLYNLLVSLKNSILVIKQNQKELEMRPQFLLDLIEFDKNNGNLIHFADSYYSQILLTLLASKRFVVIITQNEDYFLAVLLSNVLVGFFLFFVVLRCFIVTNVLSNSKVILEKSAKKQKRGPFLALLMAFSVSLFPDETELMRKTGEKAGTIALKVFAADEVAKRLTDHAPSDSIREKVGPVVKCLVGEAKKTIDKEK